MSESIPLHRSPYTLMLARVAPTAPSSYSLLQAAQRGGVHPEMLRYYCQIGIVRPAQTRPGEELTFDDDAVYELRRLEHYRRHQGVSRQTLRVLCALWREIDHLQAELRFLRRD